MNQAFVKENDGWHKCEEKQESCLFAEENGECMLEECRHYGGKTKRAQQKEQAQE